MAIAIRPAQGDEDLGFMLGLGSRLTEVIRTAAHTPAEVQAFQDEYSAANLRDPPQDALTVIAVDGAPIGSQNATPTAAVGAAMPGISG